MLEPHRPPGDTGPLRLTPARSTPPLGQNAGLPNTPFRSRPLQQLIIYVVPWPKGAPTAPEFIVTGDGDINDRRAALRAAIDKFASRGESQTFQPHAAFGVLSPKDWGALAYRHLDHHLTQFGA